MKTRLIKKDTAHKATSVALVVAMMLFLALPSMGSTTINPGNMVNNATILYFEPSEIHHEIWVDVGTSLDELKLPNQLRAVLIDNAQSSQGELSESSEQSQVDIIEETSVIVEDIVEVPSEIEHSHSDEISMEEISVSRPISLSIGTLVHNSSSLELPRLWGDENQNGFVRLSNENEERESANSQEAIVENGSESEGIVITSNESEGNVSEIQRDEVSGNENSIQRDEMSSGGEVNTQESVSNESANNESINNEPEGSGSESNGAGNSGSESGENSNGGSSNNGNESVGSEPAGSQSENGGSESSGSESGGSESGGSESGEPEDEKSENKESENTELEDKESENSGEQENGNPDGENKDDNEDDNEDEDENKDSNGEVNNGEGESKETELEEIEAEEIESEESELEEIELEENELEEKESSTGGSGGGGSGSSETEENGKTIAYTASVPVSWEGFYDGDMDGVYYLTAKPQGYNYSGVLPTAVITVGDPFNMMGGPQRAPAAIQADIIINIGQNGPAISPGTYVGFTVDAYRKITFNSAAQSHIYEIRQTGNTAGFWTVDLPAGVNTSIIFNKLSTDFYMNILGNAKLNLYLYDNSNFPTGRITVRSQAQLTIDSAASPFSGSPLGSLTMTGANSNVYAAIGGMYSSGTGAESGSSGLITINGGTLDIKQNGGAGGSTADSAVIGGTYNGEGFVVINGGKVKAEAVLNSYGAAIGGGRGGYGVVTINGGTIEAINNGRGAGIGGGSSSGNNLTMTEARKDKIEIHSGIIDAHAKNGAAIGGGQRSSHSDIKITGGNITATTITSYTGAAIGGGGGATGTEAGLIGGNLNIEIIGGDILAKSNNGAGIGHGGYQGASVPGNVPGVSGNVTITGGKIVAEFNYGTAVGTGWDNKVLPNLFISSTADIVGYGKQRHAFAGIYAGDDTSAHKNGMNQGNAYYVNISFTEGLTPNTGTLLNSGTKIIVTLGGDISNPIRVLTAPFDLGMLSFTAWSSSSQNYHLYVQTASGYRQLSRLTNTNTPLKFDNPNIYSVNETYKYYNNGHVHDSYYRNLPVKYDPGSASFHLITEKYVNTKGASVGIPDSFAFISASPGYSKAMNDLPNVANHEYKGYIWDNPPSGSNYQGGVPYNVPVSSDRTIYFVYDDYKEVNVTISKMVTGDYADKRPAFTFNIYFTDSNNNPLPTNKAFSFVGSTVAGSGATAPNNGTLWLASGGRAQFELKHGQKITIQNVPANVKIRIVETRILGYRMSYLDSMYQGVTFTTDMVLSTVGQVNRTFDFYNAQDDVVPTGINDDALMFMAFALIAIALYISGKTGLTYLKRRVSS
ncbi:MAG: hypothetical protein FWG88_06475 [Oscillospiraceae bacterium]|nr:hypothetical protein [Oscillospiraceae bacterium]